MRKTFLLFIALMMFGTLASAQGFVPEAQKQARWKELKALAGRLLEATDTHVRVGILKEMIEKDVIRDAGGNELLDGFAVPALVGLYKQGLGAKDVNARLAAIIGLGALKSSSARDPLLQALDDPDDAIQLRVIQAVSKRSIVRAGNLVVLKLSSSNADVVAVAAKCLADLGYGGAAGRMIELMATRYEKLKGAAADDPGRAEHHRVIEVLGRACGQLVAGLTWSPGPSVEALGKEVAKFTRWWNEKHLADLRDPRYEKRMEALSRMRTTADRSVFLPVLQAVVKEFERLQKSDSFADKQRAQEFIVAASAMLSRISGGSTTLPRDANTDKIKSAVKAWKAWWEHEMKNLATP